MTITAEYLSRILITLESNEKTLTSKQELLREQVDTLKSHTSATESLLKLYESLGKCTDYLSALDNMSDEAERLIEFLANWNTFDNPEPSPFDDEEVRKAYTLKHNAYFAKAMLKVIKTEHLAQVQACVESFVSLIEDIQKNGLISVPAGLATAKTFLQELKEAKEVKLQSSVKGPKSPRLLTQAMSSTIFSSSSVPQTSSTSSSSSSAPVSNNTQPPNRKLG